MRWGGEWGERKCEMAKGTRRKRGVEEDRGLADGPGEKGSANGEGNPARMGRKRTGLASKRQRQRQQQEQEQPWESRVRQAGRCLWVEARRGEGKDREH